MENIANKYEINYMKKLPETLFLVPQH